MTSLVLELFHLFFKIFYFYFIYFFLFFLYSQQVFSFFTLHNFFYIISILNKIITSLSLLGYYSYIYIKGFYKTIKLCI